MVQIEFYDNNYLKSLVPVCSMEPDTIFLLYDENCIDISVKDNFTAVTGRCLPETKVEFIRTDKGDYQEIYDKVSEIIAAKDCIIDISGGSEMMVAAGMNAARDNNCRVIYADIPNGDITDALSGQRICHHKLLQLQDFIEINGASRNTDTHGLPDGDEDLILKGCNVIFNNMFEWQTANRFIANNRPDKESMHFSAINTIPKKLLTGVSNLLKELESLGFICNLSINESLSFDFPNTRYMHYVLTYGCWLELFVYIHATRLFGDRVYLGLQLDWDNNDVTDNEIDVLVLLGNIPVCISCKMCRPNAGAVYESIMTADHFGGADAEAVIICTADMSDKYSGIVSRMNYMRVPALDINDILSGEFEVKFKKLMKKISIC